jgi:PAS domain S-box-containing protein
MKLQEKTSLVLIALLIFVLIIISSFVAVISLSSYRDLEQRYMIQDVNQAVNKLNDELVSMSSLASDWGPWDDTVEFVNGNDPNYISSNLQPYGFDNINLNIIAITDTRGNVLFSGAYDLNNRVMVKTPEKFLGSIDLKSPLMNMSDPHVGTAGLMVTQDGPLLVVSQPITFSNYTGPVKGVIIMGRYLDDAEVVRLAHLTSPSLQFTPISDPTISPSLKTALGTGDQKSRVLVQNPEPGSVAGYTIIKDIYGNDALILRITESRDIYQQGVNTTLQYIMVVLAAGLFLGVVMLFVLDRLVLSRITDLMGQVSSIGRTTDISERLTVRGDDEFSGLAAEINHMLETIGNVQRGLQASEGRFRELAELLPMIIFEMDTAGNLSYVNKAGADLFGVTEKTIAQGTNIRHYISPGDIEKMQRGLSAVRSGAKSPGQIYTLQRPDGNLMRAIVYTSLIQREGMDLGFRGVVLDITERIRLEEALTESEEYLQSLIWSIRVGILVIDAETCRILDVNPAALEMMRTTKDAVINQQYHRFFSPAEPGVYPVPDTDPSEENVEHSLLTRDGRSIPIIKYVVPVMLHGKPSLLVTFIDNSYRKQIERKLAVSEENYRALAENSADILFSMDMSGFFTYISPQINKYGFLVDEITGKPIRSIVHPEDMHHVENDLSRDLEKGAEFHSTFRILDKWENVHWLDVNGTLRLDQSGKPIGIYGVLRDDSERKRAEDAIELANKKLNLMNNITRHDILNTITGLLGCVDMAKATTSSEERMQLLDEIKDLTRIIQRQIAFTKEYQEVGVHLPLWQNLNGLMNRVLSNFKNSGLDIRVDLENTEIYADPLLEKVFYNLVDNAIRYGETITTISFYFQVSDKGLSIICEDDGAGIPPEEKTRIFERGVGRNTGMGLFLTREILAITGITILETGVPGKGARFEINIPRGTFRFTRQ